MEEPSRSHIFFLMIRRPPRSTLFPHPALFRPPHDRPPGTPPAGAGPYHRSSALPAPAQRSEQHTSELQSRQYLVCRLLLEKKQKITASPHTPTSWMSSSQNSTCACAAALATDL